MLLNLLPTQECRNRARPIIMIDVSVEFADGQHKVLKLSARSRVTDALLALTVSLGLDPRYLEEIKKEWGLAITGPLVHRDKKWINLQWLDPHIHVSSLAAEESLSLLFGRRLFSREEEDSLLDGSPFLQQILYHQLLMMYTSGLFYSNARTAAKLSALAAYIDTRTKEQPMLNKKWLRGYIPSRLRNAPRMMTVVAKNMDSIGNKPTAVVQVAFIKGLMKLDGFGILLYSATVDGHHGVLGIGRQHVCWCDDQTFEIIDLWQTESIASLTTTPTSLTINFNEGAITIEALRISQIHRLLHDAMRNNTTNGELYDSYKIQTRDDTTDDSHEEIETIRVCKAASPITRRHLRRKAFRRKPSGSTEVYPIIDHSDTVDSLNQLLDTDFAREARWSNDNPVYNEVAGARIDSTLKRSCITYTSLTQTLRKQSASKSADHLHEPSACNDCSLSPPPPPPPRHARHTQATPPTPPPHRRGRSVLSPPPPTPPPRKVCRNRFPVPVSESSGPMFSDYATTGSSHESDVELEDVDGIDQPHNRLGAYALETRQSITYTDGNFGQKSRMIPPQEALKDYSTLMREFRMFYIKLPNGNAMWELASLYQPLHKLMSRLCILCFIDRPENYQLFVEGSILSQLDRHEMEQPCSSRDYTPSPVEKETKSVNLPAQGQSTTPLDGKLALKDQGIYSSRILSLRPCADYHERLPQRSIAVPLWVKFHQCWLSVVHGSLPCTANEAITLAAIMYQLYVLDRSQSNSVIGFCRVADFLPPEYRNVKGMERKVLAQRASFLNYSREQLQVLYVEGVSTLPLYNTVFFHCKEPRRQFLANIKMYPILIGVNPEGLLRVDPRTKQILDTWPFEVLRNWGSTTNTFMIVFESSTYPVKTDQSKWMAELLAFHVNSLLRVKGEQVSPPALQQETGQERGQYFSLEDASGSSHPYFILEEERGSKECIQIEKVYEELMLTRDMAKDNKNKDVPMVEVTVSTESVVSQTQSEMVESVTYVNPKPGCSLINPNTPMREHMERLGLYKKPNEASESYDLPVSNSNTNTSEEDIYHSHEDRVFISNNILDYSDDEDAYHCNDDITYHNTDSNDSFDIDGEDSCSDSEEIYDDIIINKSLLLYNK